MAAFAPASEAGIGASHRPKPSSLWVVALAGCGAAASSLALVLTSEVVDGGVGEPVVLALLSSWITIAYVLCGLIAWLRRPASHFGPLMIAAGFGSFLTDLSWTSSDVPFTIGQALDLLPPVLFLHVFLAYPTGRLQAWFERALIVTAYATAIGLQVVRMSLGGFGPHNLFEVSASPGAAVAVLRVQLVAVGVFCLCGVGILAARRWRDGRPLRRSLALLIDAFALGLVMMGFLLFSYAFDGPAVAQIRWATFVTLGVVPVVFLIGVLHDRLVRSGVGELFLELRADPAPADLRDALARALRDPSLILAYWLPDFGSYADQDGGSARAATIGAQSPRRCAAPTGCAVAAVEPARGGACRTAQRDGSARAGAWGNRHVAGRAARDCAGNSPRGCHRAWARRRARAARCACAGSRPHQRGDRGAPSGGDRDGCLLSDLGEPCEYRQVRTGLVGHD